MKTKLIIFISAITAATLASCDKTENLSVSQTENSQLIGEEQSIEQVSSEIDGMTDEALALKSVSLRSANSKSNNWIADSTTLTIDTLAATKTLTIDFGTHCVGNDGKIRSGKIIITSTNFTKLNVERSVSFQNFVVNGDTIVGSVKKTIHRIVDLYKREAHIVESITIKHKNNGGTASRTADLNRTYDFNRPAIVRDDKIITWGTTQFTNTKGGTLNKTIADLTPLVYKVSCRQLVSGIEIASTTHKTLTIDFGDGTCDGVATVTDGSNSWVIKL